MPQTPFASRVLDQWFADPVRYQKSIARVLPPMRTYLNNPHGTGQDEAFRLLTNLSEAASDIWMNLLVHAPGKNGDLSEANAERVRAAAMVAYEVARRLYFASGAFDDEPGVIREPTPRGDREQFASRALPVLQLCGQVAQPQVTQPVVQTLVYLRDVLGREALLAVAAAVPQNANYAYDILGGGVVVPYLRTLLAEERDLVLRDETGSAAFQHLLETFAAAGNSEALNLAYTFADAFR